MEETLLYMIFAWVLLVNKALSRILASPAIQVQ